MPDSFSQTLKGLEPARLYSLRFFTGNLQDLLHGRSRDYLHGVSVTVGDADMVPERRFQARIHSCYAHTNELFDRDNQMLLLRPEVTTPVARLVARVPPPR